MAALARIHPTLRAMVRDLQRIAAANGIRIRITSARRSRKTQWRLYRRFLLGQTPFPAAYPGTSKHERGLAVDLVAYPPERLKDLGHVWESWGGRWGGRFNDPIHFEI